MHAAGSGGCNSDINGTVWPRRDLPPDPAPRVPTGQEQPLRGAITLLEN